MTDAESMDNSPTPVSSPPPTDADATEVDADAETPTPDAEAEVTDAAGVETAAEATDAAAPTEGEPTEPSDEITAGLTCPACDTPAPNGAKFCESCGADLAASPAEAIAAAPCVSCGAPPQDIIEGGYCSNCGQKQPARRDHLEIDEGSVAAVTDRGKRHRRNEDAAAIWSDETRSVVVVCDGVSSTDRPDEASQAAADTARDHLSAFLASERAITALSDAPPDRNLLEQELTAAIKAAHQAVSEVVADDPTAEPPSCTIVAGIIHWVPQPSVSVAWLGDSRGYWVNPDGSVEQVTNDHSWANQQRELGELEQAAIAADPRAHSITRWLGADAVDVEPDIVHLAKPDGGRWLACSDGLWNYAESPEAMSERVAEFDGSPLELSQRLTTFARDAGGHDNITVAVASGNDGEP